MSRLQTARKENLIRSSQPSKLAKAQMKALLKPHILSKGKYVMSSINFFIIDAVSIVPGRDAFYNNFAPLLSWENENLGEKKEPSAAYEEGVGGSAKKNSAFDPESQGFSIPWRLSFQKGLSA